MINKFSLSSLTVRCKIDKAVGQAVGRSLVRHHACAMVLNRHGGLLMYVFHWRGEPQGLRFFDAQFNDVTNTVLEVLRGR